MDGTSAENAYGAKKAQRCWDKTGPDGTMHVLEGRYARDENTFWQLEIHRDNDGPDDGRAFKRLVGEGRVEITGSRPVPYSDKTKESGGSWIDVRKKSHHVRIENFNVSRVANAVVATGGGNHDLEFQRLNFEDTRQNILIYGHPGCVSWKACKMINAGDLSHNITLDGISGLRYSKRHVRLGKGLYDVLVQNSHADASNLDGDFAVGFDVENPARDIEFRNCTSRRNIYSNSEYWNGDGFKSENETENIRWINCAAFDNADGGFDIKSENAYLENIVALRNSRNVRIWGSAVLKNVNASFSRHLGGTGTQAGLWSAGKADCHFCTLHGNAVQAHAENQGGKARIQLVDSILSLESGKGAMTLLEEGTKIDLNRSVTWEKGWWNSPKYGRISAAWEGGNDAFNSRRYGRDKGYSFK